MRKMGFTLIELLIVVAIIAILAAIAIPNFLAAQTRAKVTRAKADMRTISTGLESYAVDYSEYPPNDGKWYVTPVQLTTPISYLRSHRLPDPFAIELHDPSNPYPGEELYYTYWRIVADQDYLSPRDPWEACDASNRNVDAFLKYGKWAQNSIGPDRRFNTALDSPGSPPFSFDIVYDPTNGTVSYGNIWRTQKDSSGKTEK